MSAQKKRTQKEFVEEINGTPISDILRKLNEKELELSKKKKIIDEYYQDESVMRGILYPKLEKLYYSNISLAEDIVNRHGVNPINKDYRYNIDSPRKITEAIRSIEVHCGVATKDEKDSEIEQLVKQGNALQSQFKALNEDIDKLKEEKTKLMEQFREKHKQKINEKDKVITEKDKIIVDKVKMIEKKENEVAVLKDELFKEKKTAKTVKTSGKTKLIASKHLLEKLTDEEKIQFLKELNVSNLKSIIQSMGVETLNELMKSESDDKVKELFKHEELKKETIEVSEVDESQEKEIVENDDSNNDQKGVESDVSIEESTDETEKQDGISLELESSLDEVFEDEESLNENSEVKEEQVQQDDEEEVIERNKHEPDIKEVDKTEVEEDLLEGIFDEDETLGEVNGVKEKSKIKDKKEIDDEKFKNIDEMLYVQMLKKKRYDIKPTENKAFDLYVRGRGTDEWIPLRYVMAELDSVEEVEQMMENTDKIHLLFHNKEFLNKGNMTFTKWLLKAKTRRHKVKFSYTTLDQLKTSGLDELDAL